MPRDCHFRFLTFLTGRSFVFNNLTVSFRNFAPLGCYFSSNFVMRTEPRQSSLRGDQLGATLSQ
jgi:hypothetical protein